MKFDFHDYFILFHLDATITAVTAYIFMHPDPISFGAYCTFVGGAITCYHWFTMRDQKIPDAPGG